MEVNGGGESGSVPQLIFDRPMNAPYIWIADINTASDPILINMNWKTIMAGDGQGKSTPPRNLLIIVALSLVCISPVSAQIGFNGLYTISRTIFGISTYTYSDSKKHIGLYFELKGVMSDPTKNRYGQTFGIASAGLTRQIGDKIITYLGGGYSIRFYLDGNFDRLDQPKFNLTGGVIVTNLGSTPFQKRLSYQIGVDTQPFGLNIGIGLRLTLPRKFLK